MNSAARIYGFVFILLIGLLAGCSGSKKVTAGPENIKVSQPRIFAPNFKKALYKADMKVYGRELSGLMLFKKSKGSTRVAFISEFGLKYFDLEVPANDTAAVTFHYLIDLMNRKPVMKMLEISFGMLFLHYPENDRTYTFECQPGRNIKVIKYKGEKAIYGYEQHSGQVTDVRQNGLFKPKIRMEAGEYEVQYPSKIRFWQGKKIEIDLMLVEE